MVFGGYGGGGMPGRGVAGDQPEKEFKKFPEKADPYLKKRRSG